jgi:DNA-binding GntR family transcriptional regulator
MEELEPLAPLPSLDDQVHSTLLQAIVSGRLAPGAPLVEVTLAEQLGVSRSPVHAALQRLESELLVTKSDSHRYCVAGFSTQDVHHIYLVRARLEGLVAYLATPRMTPGDFEQASSLIQAAERANQEDGSTSVADLGRQLHGLFLTKVDNRFLIDSLQRLEAHVERGRQLAALNRPISHHSIQQHQLVLEAMMSGDAAVAEQKMRDHILNFIDEMQS